VFIRGEGTVRPLREINLVPEVSGKVVFLSPAMVNGGAFQKGEVLLRIDPVDYRLAVTLAGARIKDAESKLKYVQAEAEAAREEWRLHLSDGSKTQSEPPPLVAKEPQLMAAQAVLEAERANLKKANLNLERTELLAPFNGRVSEETVGIGQYVNAGQRLASLYATDSVEIVIPMDEDDLAWFHVPGFTPGEGPGAKTLVKARVAGQALTWEGRVVRTEGKLDERTRMINVVVRVENPYARKPPLAIGLFVAVEIQGCTLPNTTEIPRAALHQGDVVWVEDGGRLRFRKVEVARMDGDRVLIKAGLRNGEKVVLSALKAPTDNMAVRSVPAKGGQP
jgi:RND family efflux transporter MFP subunit